MMKFPFLILFLLLWSIAPAGAYIDDTVAGEAEATAGEQNTNLYRLNSASMLSLKKLKKIDEALARNPNNDAILDMEKIEKMVDTEAGAIEKILSDILKDTVKRTKFPTTLKTTVESNTYAVFKNLSAESVKDKQTAVALRNRLGRRP